MSLRKTVLERSTSLDPGPEKSVFPVGSVNDNTQIPITHAAFLQQLQQHQNNYAASEVGDLSESTALFPSMRLVLAALLCCCYMTLSVSASNISVAIICMTSCPQSHHKTAGSVDWHSSEEGYVLAAQNAGHLLMLVTGMWADRLNGKWMVFMSLVLCVFANIALPLLATKSFWFAVLARFAVGAADACLIPAANSLITRWFPQAERAAAIGIISGGRQIGALFILPAAGWLCTQRKILGGWPAIFYLSATISLMVTFFWLPFGADKPSKQCCISERERLFVESRIACESIGKRTDRSRRVPYRAMLRSKALWASVFAMVCHEYPLVIMLQFLPNYMRDVLEFAPTANGFISALPIFCLFVSKTLSSSLSSWLTVKKEYDKTFVCKIFNGIASAGLAICIGIVPHFNSDHAVLAVFSLCGAMLSAGMHTPGVQTAMVQLAPPFSGIITGWTFFAVAWFGIGNKILTKRIVQQGSATEWGIVFHVAAFVAALPVVVFSIWGSADRQIWAAPSSKLSVVSLAQKRSVTSMGKGSSVTRMSSLPSSAKLSNCRTASPPPIHKLSTRSMCDSPMSAHRVDSVISMLQREASMPRMFKENGTVGNRAIPRENSTKSILKTRDSLPALAPLQSCASIDEANERDWSPPPSFRARLSPIPKSDSLPNNQKISGTSTDSSPPPTMRAVGSSEEVLRSSPPELRRRGSDSSTSSSTSTSLSVSTNNNNNPLSPRQPSPPVQRKMATSVVQKDI